MHHLHRGEVRADWLFLEEFLQGEKISRVVERRRKRRKRTMSRSARSARSFSVSYIRRRPSSRISMGACTFESATCVAKSVGTARKRYRMKLRTSTSGRFLRQSRGYEG
jgi:hypothetical protein